MTYCTHSALWAEFGRFKGNHITFLLTFSFVVRMFSWYEGIYTMFFIVEDRFTCSGQFTVDVQEAQT